MLFQANVAILSVLSEVINSYYACKCMWRLDQSMLQRSCSSGRKVQRCLSRTSRDRWSKLARSAALRGYKEIETKSFKITNTQSYNGVWVRQLPCKYQKLGSVSCRNCQLVSCMGARTTWLFFKNGAGAAPQPGECLCHLLLFPVNF